MPELESVFVFIIGIVAILLLDLLVIGRKSHIISFQEAGIWVAVWVSLAFLFYLFLLWHGEIIHGIKRQEDLSRVVQSYAYKLDLTGNDFMDNLKIFRKQLSTNFLTGYFIEETLSLDNLFVILMILTSFSVATSNYKKVLFWGILGAIVLRSIFIFAGYAVIKKFEWVLLVFGAFLVFTGIRYMFKKEKKTDIRKQFLFKTISRNFRVYPRFVTNRFFVLKEGRNYITPLFVVLILIEFTDLIFAVDSIPAIFSVTRDPYIIFFSNIFAIIGLRSLFFFLANMHDRFWFLKYGISVLLIFVGFKLLLKDLIERWDGYKSQYSLYFILFVIVASVGISLIFQPKKSNV
jgi:TerC family integral membrane protein